MFEPIETWDDKETKRVGRSLRRQVERVIRFAKDTPFEQELKKRVGKLLASEGDFAETIAQTSGLIRIKLQNIFRSGVPIKLR